MTSLMVETIRCQACNAGITEENVRLNRCGCSICVECSRKPPAGGSTCPQCADECNELEQIKPCGCFLCKKCLINWLTATRMETDWICWSCGAAVETHTAAPQAMVAAAAAAAATASTDGKKKAAPRKKAGTPTKKRKRIPTSQKDIVDSLLSPTTNNNNNNNMTSPKDDSKTRKKRLTFQQRFEALLRYKERHGNINVPWRYDEDGNLGEWVKNVRRGVKKLTMDERRMLNSLGFSWETKRNKFDREWKERLERLKSYKRRFGDCYVPWQWEEDKQLAEWVHTQRKMNNSGDLRQDRRELLEEVGFAWQGRGDTAPARARAAAAAAAAASEPVHAEFNHPYLGALPPDLAQRVGRAYF